jgi:hypothetical protein
VVSTDTNDKVKRCALRLRRSAPTLRVNGIRREEKGRGGKTVRAEPFDRLRAQGTLRANGGFETG